MFDVFFHVVNHLFVVIQVIATVLLIGRFVALGLFCRVQLHVAELTFILVVVGPLGSWSLVLEGRVFLRDDGVRPVFNIILVVA